MLLDLVDTPPLSLVVLEQTAQEVDALGTQPRTLAEVFAQVALLDQLVEVVVLGRVGVDEQRVAHQHGHHQGPEREQVCLFGVEGLFLGQLRAVLPLRADREGGRLRGVFGQEAEVTQFEHLVIADKHIFGFDVEVRFADGF